MYMEEKPTYHSRGPSTDPSRLAPLGIATDLRTLRKRSAAAFHSKNEEILAFLDLNGTLGRHP
jgi:hypothetical protein